MQTLKGIEILKKVRDEEQSRREATLKAFLAFAKDATCVPIEIVISELESDLEKAKLLKREIDKYDVGVVGYTVKYNKLQQVLESGVKVAKNMLDYIRNYEGDADEICSYIHFFTHSIKEPLSNRYDAVENPNWDLNGIIAVFYTLAHLGEYDFSVDPSGINHNFLVNSDEYGLSSPILQGYPLYSGIIESLSSDTETSFNIKNWKYYYQVPSIIFSNAELVVPTLGYAYGGSRNVNPYYKDKEFKVEDCSSAFAKWIGYSLPNTFATSALKSLNPELQKLLNPIPLKDIQPGSAISYFKGSSGHVGIVSEIESFNENGDAKCIEFLSFTRNPDTSSGRQELYDGLMYDHLCFDDATKSFLAFDIKDQFETVDA